MSEPTSDAAIGDDVANEVAAPETTATDAPTADGDTAASNEG